MLFRSIGLPKSRCQISLLKILRPRISQDLHPHLHPYPHHHHLTKISLINYSILLPHSNAYASQLKLCFTPQIRNFHRSTVRNAEFWKVGTNIRIFKDMLKETGSTQWKYRVVLFLVIFVILNFFFNIMLTVLTNIYLDRIQPSSFQFGLWVNSEFKTGLVNEFIKMDDDAANDKYLICLKELAKENGLISNTETRDIKKIILTEKELDPWFFQKRNLNYVSVYCDLLLRYALTFDGRNHEKVQYIIGECFQLIDHFQELAKEPVGSYNLKNKALRTQADIMKFNHEDFDLVEKKLYESIQLVVENEYENKHTDLKDISIVPKNELSSNNLTNSLLDLCSFYTETRNPKYMDQALTILLSELRSLETEYSLLDDKFNSNDMYAKKKKLSTKSEKRLMELKFEKIPLINLQLSEILWFQKQYNKAIELAKESAQISSMYSSMNFNSAKIAKLGFMNLSTMFEHIGDKEGSELCIKRAEEIEVPMIAFGKLPENVRDVVLGYWFGSWGRFLFPG